MAKAPICTLQSRSNTGKHFNRASRKERQIPGVIYGPNIENINVSIEEIFLAKHRSPRFESTIFKTESTDSKISGLNVMLKSIDTHPRTGRPTHVDFYALDMKATIKVNVSINYIGESIGEKEEGGVRQIILHEVEIECNPVDIPESIDVDVSELAVNSSLKVGDLKFPSGVKPMTAEERTIITVAVPKEEKEEPAVEAAAEGEAAPAGDATAAPATDAKKD